MAFEVYDLYVKLGIDSKDFDKGIDDAKKQLESLGKHSKKEAAEAEASSTSLMGRLGSGLASFGKTALGIAGEVTKAATKVTAAAITAAGGGVLALTKAAVSSYGEYQQLAGGIETLFKSSSDQMMKYAENAYKTAGISKNKYMTIAIESSAAMINSLGGDTKAAAEYTNMAITDMSDNVNKMGTTFDSLQNAYRGFSRGNFTMLDNLSLGFAGTKQGMQELLDKAEELSGIKYDIGSYSDIVQAIHVVQQEMGITGTTAAEAAGTITGSLGSVKAAWQNLVTSLADPNADLGQLISDVVETGTKAIENLVPTIVNALEGIAELIDRIVPVIGEKLPDLVDKIVPKVLDAATSVVRSLARALPNLIDILADEIPKVLDDLFPVIIDALTSLAQGIAKVLPKLAQVIADNVDVLVDGIVSILGAIGQALLDTLPILIPAIVKLAVKTIHKLAEAFSKNADQIVSGIVEIITVIIDTLTDPYNINMLIDATITILEALMDAITNNFDKIENLIQVLVENTVDVLIRCTPILLEGLLRLLWSLIKALGSALVDGIGQLVVLLGQAGADILTSIAKWLQNVLQEIGHALSQALQTVNSKMKEIWERLGQSLTESIGSFKQTIQNFWENIKKKFEEAFSGIKSIGENLVKGLWNGISSLGGWLWRQVKNFCIEKVVDPVKRFFGISSPSKMFRQYGRYLIEGFGLGIDDESDSVMSGIKKFGNGITKTLEDVLDIHSPSRVAKKDGLLYAAGFEQGAIEGIDSAYDKIEDKVEERGKDLSEMSWRDTVESVDTLTTRTQMALNPLKKYDSGMRFAQKNQSTGLTLGGKGLNVLEEAINPLNAGITATRAMSGIAGAMGLMNQLSGNVKRTSSSGSTSGFGGGSGQGGGSGSGGYGGEGGGYSSEKIDELLDMLRELLMKDITFESDLMLDNTRIGAVITSINADNTIRAGGYY